jgi:hypothetical protein
MAVGVTGFEPADDSDASDSPASGCAICLSVSAARVLQPSDTNRHFVSLIDAGLAQLIERWPVMSDESRRAILGFANLT